MSVALMSSRGAQHPRRWTPKQLGTLSLWLDADDATTITIATGVSQWDDKSGNGRNVTQTTGANQPTRVVNARNGRAVVRFDGSNDVLTGGDVLDLLAGDLSVMAVSVNNAASSGTTSSNNILSKSDGSTAGRYALNRNGFVVVGPGLDSRDTANPTGWQVIGAVLDRATNIVGWRDGTSTVTSTTGFPNTTSYDLAASFRVGGASSDTTPQQALNGDVAEIVLSLVKWTATERQQVEGYLAHKWGLAGSLPSDHPYKDAAP